MTASLGALLGTPYRALVIGATGAIGMQFVHALSSDSDCASVSRLARSTQPGFDLNDEASMAAAATALSGQAPFQLIVDATGALTIDGVGPEKHLGALNAEQLLASFKVNAIGPALLLKHFLPLLAAKGPVIYAKLSARVGSISDNRKGGWYGYRASKAALNMLLQTAAIECQRRRPEAMVVALQPGTVASRLSAPHVGANDCITPSEAVNGMLAALAGLTAVKGAQFIDYQGKPIAW